jgi:hypothetical protein
VLLDAEPRGSFPFDLEDPPALKVRGEPDRQPRRVVSRGVSCESACTACRW